MNSKRYNFDEPINRIGTNSVKWDLREMFFGSEDVMPLWVADMDFPTPDFIISRLRKRLKHPFLGYTFRSKEFIASFVFWVYRKHAWKVEPRWVSFSPGVVSAVSMAIMEFTQPGDEVIVQPPVYFPFFKSVEGLDRKLIYNPLTIHENRLCMDFVDLRKKITGKTRMLILCNPHNPGGSAWRRDELTELVNICKDHEVMILSDEIHSDLVFSPHQHTPIIKVAGKYRNRIITNMAVSKTFNVAGLSTSVVVIPDDDMRKRYDDLMRTLHVGGGNIFGIEAQQAAYEEGWEWIEQLMHYLRKNRDLLVTRLKPLSQVELVLPESTYLAWIDFRKLGIPQEELVNKMVREIGLGLNSGTDFGPGGEGFMRLNFACPRSMLEEAIDRMISHFS